MFVKHKIKDVLFLVPFFVFNSVSAQVGINTNDPKGAFHINPTILDPQNENTADDVVVMANTGNVGIGNVSPTVKLDVKTEGTAKTPVAGFKLADGTEGDRKVLFSSADGTASWKYLNIFSKEPVSGDFNWAAYTDINNVGWNSIASLVVPPGSHMIYIKLHVLNSKKDDFSFLRTYVGTKNLGSNNIDSNDNPILGSSNFEPYYGKDFELTQAFVYNNATGAPITLYFNLQSDQTSVQRSSFTPESKSQFSGVNIIENYFMRVAAN